MGTERNARSALSVRSGSGAAGRDEWIRNQISTEPAAPATAGAQGQSHAVMAQLLPTCPVHPCPCPLLSCPSSPPRAPCQPPWWRWGLFSRGSRSPVTQTLCPWLHLGPMSLALRPPGRLASPPPCRPRVTEPLWASLASDAGRLGPSCLSAPAPAPRPTLSRGSALFFMALITTRLCVCVCLFACCSLLPGAQLTALRKARISLNRSAQIPASLDPQTPASRTHPAHSRRLKPTC